jgi:predicted  nucleic acid-binding Zn-ribbon protein
MQKFVRTKPKAPVAVECVPIGSGLWGYRTVTATSTHDKRAPPPAPRKSIAKRPESLSSECMKPPDELVVVVLCVSMVAVFISMHAFPAPVVNPVDAELKTELRSLKGTMHVTLCQLADKSLALEDSERKRAASEAELRNKLSEIETLKAVMAARDAQLAEMAEEVERLEAMNRRLEDKQSDIRRMATEVLNSKAAVREAEKLKHEYTLLKAQQSLSMPLMSAIEDLDKLLPVKSARRKSLALDHVLDSDSTAGMDYVRAASTVKAAVEALTASSSESAAPVATSNIILSTEETKEAV